MKKGFVWFLLFVGVFFLGMNVSGSKQTDQADQKTTYNREVEQNLPASNAGLPILPETEMQADTEPVFYPVQEVPEQSGGLLTNKTASLLERAVAAMYELIVGFLYNIASLLF